MSKKTVCFHLGNLSFRGTTTAILDYAYYNETLLNNKSIIAFDKSIITTQESQDFSKKQELLTFIYERYDVIEYSSKDELKKELDKRNCEYVYVIKAGFNDGNIIEGKINLVHATFNFYQPHGEKYAYVSDWLSEAASGSRCPVIPHIVTLPTTKVTDYREKYNISSDKFVVGRYGGYEQFDIPFVHDTINFIVNNDPNVVFLFVNTKKFIDHPNVKFLNPIFDPQEKTDYILSCDMMLHARSDGESFGLSIAEFMFHYRPVLSFGGGRDKNNVALLEDFDLIYNNQYELLEKFFLVKNTPYLYYHYNESKYSPETVMKQFDEVFLR